MRVRKCGDRRNVYPTLGNVANVRSVPVSHAKLVSVTPIKNAETHLQSLRDGREVYNLGQRVDDVTSHPAFRNTVASAAHLYDFQSSPENIEKMTFASPGT